MKTNRLLWCGIAVVGVMLTQACASRRGVARKEPDCNTSSHGFVPSEIEWISLRLQASCRIPAHSRPYEFELFVPVLPSDGTNDNTIAIFASWYLSDTNRATIAKMDHDIHGDVLRAFSEAKEAIYNARTRHVREDTRLEVHLYGKPLSINEFFRSRAGLYKEKKILFFETAE